MTAYSRRYRRHPPLRLRQHRPARRWRLSSRILVSFLLFALVYALTLSARPWSEALVGYARNVLTWEYDFTGALRRLGAARLPRGIGLDALRGFWGPRPRPGAGGIWPAAAYSRLGQNVGPAADSSWGADRAWCPYWATAADAMMVAELYAPPVPFSRGRYRGRRQEGCHGQTVIGSIPATTVLPCRARARPRHVPAEPVFGPA